MDEGTAPKDGVEDAPKAGALEEVPPKLNAGVDEAGAPNAGVELPPNEKPPEDAAPKAGVLDPKEKAIHSCFW